MADIPRTGIYLFVQFNWPENMNEEVAQKAADLHKILQGETTWIRETLAASGGVGSGPSSWWVFWLENYGALDRLLKDRKDPIAQAYYSFFSSMMDMSEAVREEVLFR